MRWTPGLSGTPSGVLLSHSETQTSLEKIVSGKRSSLFRNSASGEEKSFFKELTPGAFIIDLLQSILYRLDPVLNRRKSGWTC